MIVVPFDESTESPTALPENSITLPVGTNPEPVIVTVVPIGPKDGERLAIRGPCARLSHRTTTNPAAMTRISTIASPSVFIPLSLYCDGLSVQVNAKSVPLSPSALKYAPRAKPLPLTS